MSFNISGYNISDIYIGDDKIDRIFVGEDLVYSSGPQVKKYFGFQIDDPTKTAMVGFSRIVDSGVDSSTLPTVYDPSFSYSFDRVNWVSYTLGSDISIGSGCSSDVVYFKTNSDDTSQWTGNTYDSGSGVTYWTSIRAFTKNNNVSAIGNVMVLRFTNVSANMSLSSLTNAFSKLFSGCTKLTTAPELSAVALGSSAYECMFEGCTSLTAAPELPSSLDNNPFSCYSHMFEGCTSLTVIPGLPSDVAPWNGYQYMFSGCTSLTIAPELPATNLGSGCYQYMFNGCTSLTVAPELPITNLASDCYNGMFRNCTSLTVAPELPATVMKSYCYSHMFQGCTSLRNAPELPATTLASSCYISMFAGCPLSKLPYLPATTLAGSCYQYMFAETSGSYRGIKANSSSSSPCIYACSIPPTGSGSAESKALDSMFVNLAGNGSYTPSVNTTFYTSVPMASA